ncbi:MAG TPA: hypothetical protein VHM65_05750, partial [Candidatus Lustribacter sp.]|nr:hypothetical protein [Candidatus Lustribacter sp.]
MHSLPVCAYVALWATSAYTTGEPAAGLVFQACPGAAFAGDHDRLDLWREAGETVVCAAFPTPGHAHGMPRTSPAALAAVTASGQC